jgi:hypothetical protein
MNDKGRSEGSGRECNEISSAHAPLSICNSLLDQFAILSTGTLEHTEELTCICEFSDQAEVSCGSKPAIL